MSPRNAFLAYSGRLQLARCIVVDRLAFAPGRRTVPRLRAYRRALVAALSGIR